MTDTRPTFSRITESRSSKAWRSAVPAIIVVIAFIALLGYLASSVSSSQQKAMALDRDNQQMRDQQQAMGRQISDLQAQLAVARSPGRTTVVLQAPASKGKSAKADTTAKTWAAATWGETPQADKSWMRVNAYGLQPLDQGKAYHVWFVPQSGDPVSLGTVDADSAGNGALESPATLPPVDQGKSVQLTLDDASAKLPGEVVAQADLPKLQPTAKVPPVTAPAK
ncbi:MAG TPA: anti-sigma factor [Myxococcales bacterium]|nr:anti-sigma factor [Myxococcales bacterium]